MSAELCWLFSAVALYLAVGAFITSFCSLMDFISFGMGMKILVFWPYYVIKWNFFYE